MAQNGIQPSSAADSNVVTDRVFTAANIITFVRLLMIPAYFIVLLQGHNLAAAVLFAAAAATDFLDGQVARRTHTVSRVGQLLDPVVDRLLMIFGVLGVFIVGRIPLWIIVLVLARDLLMLVGGAYFLARYKVRVPVIYAGKVATTLFFVGFIGLILNQPLLPGLGLTQATWLPGFNGLACSWGIWFIYPALVLGLVTTAYYVVSALRMARASG